MRLNFAGYAEIVAYYTMTAHQKRRQYGVSAMQSGADVPSMKPILGV